MIGVIPLEDAEGQSYAWDVAFSAHPRAGRASFERLTLALLATRAMRSNRAAGGGTG